MFFALLWEALVYTFIFWKWVFPVIVRFAMWPVKLSLLHFSTLFKGWMPVATAMAATRLVDGMAVGNIPQNPTDWDRNMALMNAHIHIGLGAFINFFTGFYILTKLVTG